MKKTLLSILIVLLCFSFADAQIISIAKKKAGGGAASGIYRPEADITISGWYAFDDEPDDFWSYVDDAVTAPTAGSGGNNALHAGEAPSSTLELAFPEITGTVSTLRVYTYAKVQGATDGELTFSVSRDGTNWVSAGTVAITENDTYAWLYTDATGLSWDGTTDLRLRATSTATGTNVDVDVFYLEANP